MILTLTLNPCIDRTARVCALKTGETNRVLSSREDIGGKGLNVSRVLRGCGIPVTTAGLAGTEIAEKLRAAFTAPDCEALFIPTHQETRVNLKIIVTQSGAMTELNEAGKPVGDALPRLWQALLSVLPRTNVLTLSGSLPPDVDTAFYRDCIAAAGRYGVRVVLDADGEAMRKGVEAAPFAVKPNLAELSHWAGCALTDTPQVVSQIRALHDKGVEWVCVSMGADGALFSDGKRIFRTTPFPIRVGSPAAAGDAMAAMLAYGIAQSLPTEQIARLATAAGTCTAEKEGTQTADFAEIRTRADAVRVTVL